MKNKTPRPITIKFPTVFTIDILQRLYPDTPTITLRWKTEQSRKEGSIAYIGKTSGKLGRPKKIYSLVPVTEEAKKTAVESGFVLDSENL